MASRSFTLEEVAKHNKDGDAWIVIENVVYDVSKFAPLHPGGRVVLLKEAGKDCTDIFNLYHNSSILAKYHEKLRIGTLNPPVTRKKPALPGTFGDMVAFGDPLWYQRFNSPYYKNTHREWRARVRAFVDKEVMPYVAQWRDKAEPPRDLVKKMGDEGFLAVCSGNPWPTQYTPAKPPADYDYFHELIFYDELARSGNASLVGALTNGPAIALPVILRFGTEEQKQRIAPPVLAGTAFIALAISEPQAGSDVAGLHTTAVREGDYYIVNGNKKWITNGTYAEYFVTAVRTGPKGQGGLSFLLVERNTPGLKVRALSVRASSISGTAYLDFDNARVPAANLIGRENDGWKLIMFNFNHERFYITSIVARMARICVEECIKYATRRQAFGKSLDQHQAVRMKIARMCAQVECLQAMLDYVAYQLCTMKHNEANLRVGDVMSLLKAHASRVYEACARETTHVFGGNSMLVGGVGDRIESAVGQVKGYAIPGGAEDVLEDFAARSAFKLTRMAANL